MLAWSVAATAFADDLGADSDDPFEGFDEDADDPFGGFDDDEAGEPDAGFDEADPNAPPKTAFGPKRFWELTGNVSVGASINYLDHESDTGTDYTGLSRLRTRLNLQLDIDLPGKWKGRLAGFGFYDWAYLAGGRNDYTDEVLDVYEWDADFQEVWLQGPVHPRADLKIGRQIINWGRSDTLRVLDVLNPLDNREPGLVDIEDLRRPVMMLRGDAYCGDWTLTLVAIPEIRFNKDPPIGSDFAPVLSSLGAAASFVVPENVPDESFDNTEWAVALSGVFSGWDVSLHFARSWSDSAYLRPVIAGPLDFSGSQLRHSRFTLVGAGANYTFGSWLIKTEMAWLDGLDYTTSTRMILGPVTVDVPTGSVRRSRLDFMAGVEYYGFTDTNVALEIANRHIFGFRSDMRPHFGAERNSLETALRITRNFMNDRLEVTVLALAFGNHAQDGSVVRLSASYDLRDALVVSGGILLFQKGDRIPFDSIARNDRLFVELKYSF